MLRPSSKRSLARLARGWPFWWMVPLALVLGGLVPRAAAAGETERGGYVLLAPGAVHLPVGSTDHNRVSRLGYHWGIAAGGVFDVGRLFRVTLGVGFEHALHRRDKAAYARCPEFDCGAGGQLFRLAPALRLGLGRQVFGYAFVEPGLAMRYNAGRYEEGTRDVQLGFGSGAGLGLQVKVWERLFLGLEAGGDIALLKDPAYEFDGKVLIGWSY